MPGTRWEVKMRTQTVEDGAKPQTSKWSDKVGHFRPFSKFFGHFQSLQVTLTTQSLPGELFVTVEPTGPREALVTWDLPDKDQKWNYGVDISYRLKQLGGCNEAATGSQEPITKLNIQEKQVPLEELAPGSVYEVRWLLTMDAHTLTRRSIFRFLSSSSRLLSLHDVLPRSIRR